MDLARLHLLHLHQIIYEVLSKAFECNLKWISSQAMDAAAFPNPWENGKGGKGGKGRKGEKGQDGEKGKGRKGDRKGDRGKGGGKGGKGGKGGGDEESLPSERKDQLEAELVALSRGTETSAIPRVGDLVQVRTLGSDPQQLQGKMGRVIGIALLPSLKNSGGAVSIRFDADAGLVGDLDVSVAASDIRILEAVRPLPEGSLTFPKTLSGLERKFVHSVAEKIGLISQSFGKGEDRYITVYRAAEGSRRSGAEDSLESSTSAVTKNIDASGVELDAESKAALLEAMTIPEGWAVSADRMVICRGPFQKPKQMDHRSVTWWQSQVISFMIPKFWRTLLPNKALFLYIHVVGLV